LLTASGTFIQISFAQPHFRRKYLHRPDLYSWSCTSQTIDKGFGYFFYTMSKDPAWVPAIALVMSESSPASSPAAVAPLEDDVDPLAALSRMDADDLSK
jgi:hypothetical protein